MDSIDVMLWAGPPCLSPPTAVLLIISLQLHRVLVKHLYMKYLCEGVSSLAAHI